MRILRIRRAFPKRAQLIATSPGISPRGQMQQTVIAANRDIVSVSDSNCRWLAIFA